MSLRAVGRKRIGRSRRDPDFRIRFLVRLWHQADILERMIFPFVGKSLLREGALKNFQNLGKPFAAFGVRHAIGFIGARKSAPPDTKDQAAMADVINRRHFLGQAQRMTQRQNLHGDAEFHPRGARRDRGGDGQRRGDHGAFRRHMQLRQPHHIEPPALGGIDDSKGFRKRVGFALPRAALELMEHAEFHRGLPSWRVILAQQPRYMEPNVNPPAPVGAGTGGGQASAQA